MAITCGNLAFRVYHNGTTTGAYTTAASDSGTLSFTATDTTKTFSVQQIINTSLRDSCA